MAMKRRQSLNPFPEVFDLLTDVTRDRISAHASGRQHKARCVSAGNRWQLKLSKPARAGERRMIITGLSLSSIALNIFFQLKPSPDRLGFMLSPSSTA